MKITVDRQRAKTVIKLAYPVMFAMLTQTAINLVDTIMVGHLPGDVSIDGQSAIGYSLILLWAVGGFLSCIQVGTQAITARRFGEDRRLDAGAALTNSLLIAVVLGISASVLAYLYIDDIFRPFVRSSAVFSLGTEYASFRMLGVFSMVATASYKAFFDGIGKTHVHMVAAIVMNIANILLNWVLIFGVGPFPEMQVAGAGLGSLISTYIGLFMMILWSGFPRYLREYRYYAFRNMKLKTIKDIIRVSVPGGIATVFVMAGFFMFISFVELVDGQQTLGILTASYPIYDNGGADLLRAASGLPLAVDSYLVGGMNRPTINTAATKIIMDIMSLSFMSMIALGTATATLVGQSLGRRRKDDATAYGWTSVKLGIYLMIVFATFALLFPDACIGLFNKDASLIAAGRSSLRLMAISSVFIAMGMVLAQALFGAGYSRYVMWVEATLHILCLVPLSYVMGMVFNGGLMGIWSAAFTYIFLLACAMAWKFHEGSWKEVTL